MNPGFAIEIGELQLAVTAAHSDYLVLVQGTATAPLDRAEFVLSELISRPPRPTVVALATASGALLIANTAKASRSAGMFAIQLLQVLAQSPQMRVLP